MRRRFEELRGQKVGEWMGLMGRKGVLRVVVGAGREV